MTATWLRLQKKIPDHLSQVLRLVFSAAERLKIPAFVVGATGRDLLFEYVYGVSIQRATEDLDLGVAVGSWDEYARLRATLCQAGNFRLDRKIGQRIWWRSDNAEMKLDLVPYGAVENPPGTIVFPPDGDFVMSTQGFAEASQDACLIALTDEFAVRVASPAGLVLLKFVAYHDRPQQRRRDVQDIWFIARNYLKTGDDARLFAPAASDADLLEDEQFDYETCGARLLGRDLAPLLQDTTQAIISRLLAEEIAKGSLQKLADVIFHAGFYDENEYQKILDTFRALRTGIKERINKAAF